MSLTLSVCMSCAGGRDLADALDQELPAPYQVNRVSCMNVCTRPASVSLRQTGKHAYLFGDVTPAMAENVATLVTLFDAEETGAIADARPLGPLRFCLIGRIPI
ncbi:MAG: DUF1636 family protein [Thalassovita sp.]